MKPSVFVIMGTHLFPIKHLPAIDYKNILMIEDYEFCTHFKYHKKKLVFLLESMRNYADNLREEGFHVTYIPLKEGVSSSNCVTHLKEYLQRHNGKSFESYEIEDRFFRNKVS